MIFKRRLSKLLLFIVLICLPAAVCVHASEFPNPKTKRILVILFTHEGIPWAKRAGESLAKNLSSETSFPVELTVEYLDRLRYPEDAYLEKILDMYRYKYTNSLDLVVGIGGDPSEFLVQHGEELFGKIPLVTVSFNPLTTEQSFLKTNLTSLQFGMDIQGNVTLVERLFPKTRQLFIVTGSSKIGIETEKTARTVLKNYSGPLTIDYISNLTEENLLKKVSHLPKHSALLYLIVSRDSTGKTFVPREILARIADKANAPVFGVASSYLGYGIVGGNLLSANILGRRCALTALHLLKGEAIDHEIVPHMFSELMFDWRQMKRWGVSEKRLPPGSTIQFKTPTAWDSYRWYIISVVLIVVLQSCFLFLLLRQRRQNLLTKSKLRERLRFEEILSTFSTDFINLPADQLSLQIEHKLKELGKFLQVDRISVFKFSEKEQRLDTFQSFTGVDVPAPPAQIVIDQLSWLKQKLVNGETIAVSDVRQLPESARQEKEYFHSLGIQSVLALPFSYSTSNKGVLSIAMIRDLREWKDEQIRRYGLIAEIIANALARQQYETALLQSRDFNRSILDSMFNHLAVLDHDGVILDVNESWQRFALENDATTWERMGRGVSYLDVCRQSAEDGDETAQAALVGIQSVLDRTNEHFTLEYPCHSPTSERWFLMKVVPFTGRKGGVIISHSDITMRKLAEIELREAYTNIEQLKNKLELESNYLKEQIKLEHNYGTIVGNSDVLKNLLYKVEKVAAADTAVLILGETGTGKELIAQVIHDISTRKGKPLVKVNCAALPSDLIESELFGHEKGAFTGAYQRKIGRFELANGGTIFLDEIGDLPIELQVKLLRVLQEGEFERLGNSETLKVDVRIIAATNRDLEHMVSTNTFRQDLYYRLNVYPVICPPLRERAGDIPMLVKHFIDKYSKIHGTKILKVPKKAYNTLESYTWPGNVRELENIIERALVVSRGSVLELGDWFPKNNLGASAKPVGTLKAIERKHIIDVLELTSWRVSGSDGAAEKLGLKPTTLEARMKKMGISRKKR